jgi:hypothetical protein
MTDNHAWIILNLSFHARGLNRPTPEARRRMATAYRAFGTRVPALAALAEQEARRCDQEAHAMENLDDV